MRLRRFIFSAIILGVILSPMIVTPVARADSYSDALAIINDSANDTKLGSMVLKWPSVESGLSGLGITENAAGFEGMNAVQEAAAVVPTLGSGAVIPVITTGATAYLATREVLHLTGGDTFLYKLWGGTPTTPVTAGSRAPYTWTFQGGCCSFNNGGTAKFYSNNDLILSGQGFYTDGGDTSFQAAGAGANVVIPCFCGSGHSYLIASSPGTGTGGSRQASLKIAQQSGLIQSNIGQQSDYDGSASQLDLGSRPATCDATCLTSIRSTLADGTAASIAAAIAIADALPGYDPSNPPLEVGFLEPLPNEDYQTYVARLRADGWLGSVTQVTTETTALDGYGPNALTRVLTTPAGGTQRVYDPLHWPSPLPTIAPSQDIQVRINPSNAVPAPTTGTGESSCGSTVGTVCFTEDISTGSEDGGGDCDTCAIDWTPIENLDVGTKFPFGVPNWTHDFFGGLAFDGSSCPTLSIGKPAALGGGSIDIPWCSQAWEDTYRPIVFPILEALMTLAAITYLGSRIFGIGSTGGSE